MNANRAPAQITLARYTHALPEDIEKARVKLAAYLAEAEKAEAAGESEFVPFGVPSGRRRLISWAIWGVCLGLENR